MHRFIPPLVFLLLVVACGGLVPGGGPATPAPRPTPDIEAIVDAQVQAQLAAMPTSTESSAASPAIALPPVLSPTRRPVAVPALSPTRGPVVLPGVLLSATPEPATLAPLATLESYFDIKGDEPLSGDVLLLMDQGDVLFDDGRYLDAIAKYEEAEEKHGGRLGVAQNRMGSSQLRLENYDLAIQHHTNHIEIGDKSNRRVNRAIAYSYSNRCPEAIDDARAALRMEPVVGEGFHTHVEAYVVLADCLVRSGDYSLALEHFDSVFALAAEHGFRDSRIASFSRQQSAISDIADGLAYPEDFLNGPASLYSKYGHAYFEQGLYEQAIGSFESAAEKNWTDSGNLFNLLGVSYSKLGLHQEALRYFSRAIEVRDDGNNRMSRAFEYLNVENGCDLAVIDAEAALGHPPLVREGSNSHSGALWVRGQCYVYWGLLDFALTDVEEAIRLARESGGSPFIASMEEAYQALLNWQASQGSPAP